VIAVPDDAGSASISLRVPADILEKLDRIAAAIERPRSWVCLRAIRQFLAEEGQEILDVQKGIAELDRGEGVPFDEVMAGLEEIIRKDEAKRGVG
jgi:predicted transcriptional regulator